MGLAHCKDTFVVVHPLTLTRLCRWAWSLFVHVGRPIEHAIQINFILAWITYVCVWKGWRICWRKGESIHDSCTSAEGAHERCRTPSGRKGFLLILDCHANFRSTWRDRARDIRGWEDLQWICTAYWVGEYLRIDSDSVRVEAMILNSFSTICLCLHNILTALALLVELPRSLRKGVALMWHICYDIMNGNIIPAGRISHSLRCLKSWRMR